MRIAIDLTALSDNFSGIERYACEMTKAMLGLGTGDEFVLLFKDDVFPDFREWATDLHVDLRIIPSHGRSKLFFSQLILPKYLYATPADIYLFMAFPAPVLFFSKSTVSTIHDLSCWDCPQTMTAKSRLLWRVLDAKATRGSLINTISEFSKNRIVEHYHVSDEKVTVSYCGVSDEFERTVWEEKLNTDEIRLKYRLPDRYVLTLSTIEPRKNIPELIKAWCAYQKVSCDPADLVLAGRKGWKTDSLLEGLSTDELSHVHITGFVDDDDLAAVYGMAENFVFPSLYEGFGLPPVEARLAGTTVICSDIPCLREIMSDAAKYYKLGDVNGLTALFEGTKVNLGELPRKYTWSDPASLLIERIRTCFER